MVGLLVVFRDKGLGVPNIALLWDFFSVKEAVEGFFVYFQTHQCQVDHLGSFVLPQTLEETFFFVSGRNWEYNPIDREDTLGIPIVWTASENLRELSFALIEFNLRKS